MAFMFHGHKYGFTERKRGGGQGLVRSHRPSWGAVWARPQVKLLERLCPLAPHENYGPNNNTEVNSQKIW